MVRGGLEFAFSVEIARTHSKTISVHFFNTLSRKKKTSSHDMTTDISACRTGKASTLHSSALACRLVY